MAKEKIPADIGPNEPLADYMARKMAQMLRGEDKVIDPEAEALEAARKKCRKGNPFPLIALQWPETLLTDPEEIEIFQRSMKEERFALCTASIKDACFDSDNPPLRFDFWQKIILAGFFAIDIGEVYIKGATGVGKGGSAAFGFCLWYDVYKKSRVTLTGRDKEHAIKNIFGETKNWFLQMAHPSPGRVLGESIDDHERHYIKLLNPDPSSPTAGEAFSGGHGDNTLYGFDEQSSLPDSFVTNARKNAQKMVSLSNPRDRVKDFYRAFEAMGENMDRIGCCAGKLGKRLCVTVGGPDCINVAERRLKTPVAPIGGFEINGRKYGDNEVLNAEDAKCVKPLIPRQMDMLQFHMALSEPLPDCFAYGKFPKEDAQRQIILASWLQRHEEAWRDNLGVTCVGLDVALSLEGDNTVLAVGGIEGCRAFHPLRLNNTIAIAKEVIRILKDAYGIDLTSGTVPVCIDYGGGYGNGVGSSLKEYGVWVIEFQPGGTSSMPKNYANLRAEGYGTLGLRLDPHGPMSTTPWAIPLQNGLREELCAPERVFANDMIRWRVHPKSEIKQTLGRSPDFADSLTYLFHAVRKKHELDQWLFAIKNRPLMCFPANQEEVAAVRKIVDETPKPKTEWDDVKFDWAQPKKKEGEPDEPRKIIVAKPDKYPKVPWWHRYVKD